MNNLLRFIGKHSNFLVFIILEVVAFLLIGTCNDYPHSKFLSTSNAIAGWQYEQITNIRNFFALRSINNNLAAENARLRSLLLPEPQLPLDTLPPYSPTPLPLYSSTPLPPYSPTPQYLSAKVVQLTLFEQRNYLTINRGEADSVYVGQGVRNNQGVVGIVSVVNKHYSIVLPLIHTESNLSCRFLKNDYIGTLTWDGKNPDYAYLEDVATHIPVLVGDTLVTSGLTSSFEEGIPVGVVDNATLEEGDSYYTIRVKLATNFRKIKYVEVIQTPNNELNYGVE